MDFPFYVKPSAERAIPIVPVLQGDFEKWLSNQDSATKEWINRFDFRAKPETFCVIPRQDSLQIQLVLLGVADAKDFLSFGALPFKLPKGLYQIDGITDITHLTYATAAWGLGAYEFTRYKKSTRTSAQLVVSEHCHSSLHALVEAIYLVRDLINTPAENMGPADLANKTKEMAKPFNAKVEMLVGEALLDHNYPTIHTVGRASTRPPQLIDLHWGNPKDPAVTLVGKGVCFDSGGLDLKTPAGMALMKKDMAGAAHVLGLAQLIMSQSLPVYLRVLIPTVDNVVSGNAYKPGDVIVTRKGLSVEVNNTDAEGRLIISDALTEAASKNPALLLDFTTLTGAARVALGPDITAMFCNDSGLAQALLTHAKMTQDPIVELPLYKPYRKYLDSQIADLTNAVEIPYGGAITASLFLNEFVPADVPWAHFDLMAWNLTEQGGRPQGAEAMAIRAVWSYLVERFKAN